MNSKFFTKRRISSIFAVIIAIILAAIIFVPTLTAHAAYSGQSGGMTREQLHAATLAAFVSNDTPSITVLTHGLDGRARDWSNDFNGTRYSGTVFQYDAASIIEKIRSTSSSGIQLFRAETSSASSFALYPEYSTETADEKTTITDFSKHTVVVMDIPGTKSNTMQELYNRLHYVIDKISYDYYIKKSCLPRINFIGHSMGGLLNMQYAIEHPKNVAALVSMGTPYNGSWYDNWLVESAFGIKDFKKQPCLTGTCNHSYYFCDVEKRKNTWNSVYSQNSHIKFYALSGEMSPSILNHIFLDNKYLEDYKGEAAAGIRTAYIAFFPLPNYLPGDICVDTYSQKAVGFDGAINYNKVFTTENCDVNKRSQDALPFPHNLEARDNDMINCIIRIIDYGNNTPYRSYVQNGIKASIVAKSGDKWLIQLTNNTGSARCFEYNQMMCNEGDAQNWNGLGNIGITDTLASGASTIIEIQENFAATSIVISYDSGSTRYIFYAKDLDNSLCTMTSYGNFKTCYNYTRNNMKVSILSKYGGNWIIKLTNNTGSAHSFDYNQTMCFDGNAQNWTGLTNIATTLEIANGDSTIIKIQEYGTATSIALSYTSGSTRYIFYANNLNTSGMMTSYSNTRTYYSYTQHDIKASIIGKNSNKWLIKLTNNTGSARSFDYNAKMCFDGDAQNWNGLTNIATTLEIASGASTIIEIQENGTATSIAISYINGSNRYIFYANNLNDAGTMIS